MSIRSPRGAAPRPTLEARPLPPESLAFALLGAARIGLGVREGHSLRDGLAKERVALDTASKRVVRATTDRPRSDPMGAMHDLAARSLRHRGRADALLALLAPRALDPPLLRELLVVAIAQVVDALDPALPDDSPAAERFARLPYAPFTLVDQAVRAVSSDPALARAKGFVNAVLRTLLRRIESERPALQAALDGPRASDESRYGLPAWWVDRLRRAWPSDWQAIVEASRGHPPLVLRVNVRKTTPEAYLARLADAGIAAERIGPVAIRLAQALPVQRIPGFGEGDVSVQDAAAQLAASLLDVRDGMRVLDACAAPGGKTGHVLELADCEMVALDVDASRLQRIRENLDRLDLKADLVAGDAARPEAWWDGRRFDRILADVPCTASGILRRHPDIRWLRRPADVESLSLRAQQITDALWSLLDPGGRLLFVTCSVFPEESARHADAFAYRHPDAIVRASPGQLLPGRVDASLETSDHDGLFFAVFEKTK